MKTAQIKERIEYNEQVIKALEVEYKRLSPHHQVSTPGLLIRGRISQLEDVVKALKEVLEEEG